MIKTNESAAKKKQKSAEDLKSQHQTFMTFDIIQNSNVVKHKIQISPLPSFLYLTPEFKKRNSVFPRVVNCSPNDYTYGPIERFENEVELNKMAWAFVILNPELEGKQTLIQRALDCWRSNQQIDSVHPRRGKKLLLELKQRERLVDAVSVSDYTEEEVKAVELLASGMIEQDGKNIKSIQEYISLNNQWGENSNVQNHDDLNQPTHTQEYQPRTESPIVNAKTNQDIEEKFTIPNLTGEENKE